MDATADLVIAFKPQIAYFAAHRAEAALERLIAHMRQVAPQVPVILDAKRGDIASTATAYADAAFGPVWDVNRYSFIVEGSENPDTVNPSLWRQAQLNNIHGLFEVVPGIWQVRAFDIANMTLVRGDTGWIVFDPLTCAETAAAALALAAPGWASR